MDEDITYTISLEVRVKDARTAAEIAERLMPVMIGYTLDDRETSLSVMRYDPTITDTVEIVDEEESPS